MPVIKCKMCGGDLNIVEDSTVCECEYCGTKQTVPKVDDEKKLKLFERANRLRTACEFDKAAGVYESIVADFDEEAEAYWGLILCKFGIEYVDDPATGNKIPTCHRSSFDSLMDDPNFDMVMECADPIARKVYREEARQIEKLRKRIIEVSNQEEPYDVFISYKELDDEGQRTLDSVIAQDIYTELTEKGYRVFFSRISLEDKLGVEYEPYIFAALNSAKVMLVVGTDYDYFNAVWVKNEWSRFLMLIASGQKKTLIPVFKGIDAYDMPKEFRRLAAQDMGKVGAMQDLVRGMEKLLGKKGPEEASKEQPGIVQSGGPNVTALLDRGFLSLEDSDWSKAQELFDQVLNIDSRNGDAYLGLAMAEDKCQDRDMLHNHYINPISALKNNRHLKRARQFGGNDFCNWILLLEKEREKKELEYKLIIGLRQLMRQKIKVEEKTRMARIKGEEQAKENIKRIQAENKQNAILEFRKKQELVKRLVVTHYEHTLGLKVDGTVVATGERFQREQNVAGWSNIVAITTDFDHTVGLKADGTVVATGDNKTGQCEVSTWRNIVAIATSSHHTVGLKADGTVVSTPPFSNSIYHGYYGQCEVSAWRNIVSIDTSYAHTVGLRVDGTVVAVGDNRHYQCNVSEWKDIIAVAAGWESTVGLKADGTVVTTGTMLNWKAISVAVSHYDTPIIYGLNADNTVNVESNQIYDLWKAKGWTDIVAVDAGKKHIVGLRADGTAVALGNNDYDQCEVSGWTDIVAVAAGSNYTLGLKADGSVVAIGDNRYGQCNVSGWKLFDNFETIEAEQKAAAEKAEAERKAAEERTEAERREKIADYEWKLNNCKMELSNLKGLFNGKRRKELEANIAWYNAELKKLK